MIDVIPGAGAAPLRLMEAALREGEQIAPEYPLVFDPRFPGQTLALQDEDEVRSACAVLTREFVTASGTLRGGMIGSVSTDARFRSRGYASRLLLEAEAVLQMDGCAFALLWTGDTRLYSRLGYCPIGVEQDFRIPTDARSKLPTDVGVRSLDVARDAAAVHTLYTAQPTRVQREVGETAALLDCPKMRSLVLERDGEVVAYACRGRGQDFEDTIHEWAGAATDVLALVRAHLEDRFQDEEGCLLMVGPTAATEVREGLVAAGAETERGILGWGKLLSRDAAATFLDEHLGTEGSADVVREADHAGIRIRGAGKQVLLDDEGALALLLGADPVRESVENFKAQFGCTNADLPFEPFAWGLDSI